MATDDRTCQQGGTAFLGRTSSPLWQRAVSFSVAYFVCAEAGSFLSARDTGYVSFWLPAGLYVAVLLLNESRAWPWLVLAAFPANLAFDLFHETKFPTILFFYCANTVQAVLGAWLVRRFVAERPTLTTLEEFVGLLGFAAVLSTMVGAAVGAATLTVSGLSNSFVQSYQFWWGSNAMAILLLSPFILTWFSCARAKDQYLISFKKLLEATLLLSVLAALTLHLLLVDKGIMSPNKGRLLLPLLWAGLRFGPRGATAANLFLALLITFFTTRFFTGLTQDQISGQYVFILQTSLAVAALVGLIPAIVLSERDQTTAKLRESEEHYRNLTAAAFEGIGISENGRIVDVNEQLLKMFGYEREEIIGREVIELVAPESRPIVAESIRSGREEIYEHRLLRKDGSFFYAEARAKMVRTANRSLRMTALRDITERKQSEHVLRESETRLRTLTDASFEGIGVCKDGMLVDANDQLVKMLGYTWPEMIGKPVIELVAPESRELVRQMTKSSRAEPYEHMAIRKDGTVFPVEVCGRTIATDPHHIRLTAVRDISERKRAEEALHENQRVLSTLLSNLPGLVYRCQNDSNWTMEFVSEGCRELTGHAPDELLGNRHTSYGQIIHSDDQRAVSDAVQAALLASGPFELTYRIRTATGVEKWIWERGRGIFSANGELLALEGFVTDVTAQHQAEAERANALLRERQAREEYTHLLIASQEAERRRIAGELHDSLSQNLLLIKNRALLALSCAGAPAELREQLENISQMATGAVAEVRQISHVLHPYQLDHLGLTAALEAMIDSAANSSAVTFERKLDLVDDVFSMDAATNLYRAVQECLNNILKHAQARSVRVELDRDVDHVRLWIEDDGRGFDVPKRGANGRSAGLGLRNIAERVRILGGSLRLDSNLGQGTRIEVLVPIPDRD